jgi:hypothetical protein
MGRAVGLRAGEPEFESPLSAEKFIIHTEVKEVDQFNLFFDY